MVATFKRPTSEARISVTLIFDRHGRGTANADPENRCVHVQRNSARLIFIAAQTGHFDKHAHAERSFSHRDR